MTAAYVLGSDTEVISFEHGRAEYRRLGISHAVDLHDPANEPDAMVGYALCGKPVRIWRDERFDPSAPEADQRCLDATRGRDRESASSS